MRRIRKRPCRSSAGNGSARCTTSAGPSCGPGASAASSATGWVWTRVSVTSWRRSYVRSAGVTHYRSRSNRCWRPAGPRSLRSAVWATARRSSLPARHRPLTVARLRRRFTTRPPPDWPGPSSELRGSWFRETRGGLAGRTGRGSWFRETRGGLAVMRLAWYAQRLASMTPGEIVGRARDSVMRRRWRRRQIGSMDADDLVVPTGVRVPLPALPAPHVDPGARAALVAAADGVMAGTGGGVAQERRGNYTP